MLVGVIQSGYVVELAPTLEKHADPVARTPYSILGTQYSDATPPPAVSKPWLQPLADSLKHSAAIALPVLGLSLFAARRGANKLLVPHEHLPRLAVQPESTFGERIRRWWRAT
jgi:hypothetical protein